MFESCSAGINNYNFGWSNSQWQFGQSLIKFSGELTSDTSAVSGNLDTAFMWQTSVCLSYPHLTQLLSGHIVLALDRMRANAEDL